MFFLLLVGIAVVLAAAILVTRSTNSAAAIDRTAAVVKGVVVGDGTYFDQNKTNTFITVVRVRRDTVHFLKTTDDGTVVHARLPVKQFLAKYTPRKVTRISELS